MNGVSGVSGAGADTAGQQLQITSLSCFRWFMIPR